MKIKGYHLQLDKAVEIIIENGIIKEISDIEYSEDLSFLSIGFTDLQVNGYCGIDYSSDTLTSDGIYSIVDDLMASGTAYHMPTIISQELNKTVNNIFTITGAVKQSKFIRDAVVGIHLEGPYISPEDGVRGVHSKKFIRKPDINELKRCLDASYLEADTYLLKMITVAPEVEGAQEFIAEARKLGVKVSIGHSNAKSGEIKKSVDNGVSTSTHLGNGITQLIDRRENPIWQQLVDDRLKSGIIADGFHLNDEQIITFKRTKSLNNLFLVSDVGPYAGKKSGVYRWGTINVKVHEDGHLGLNGTPYLAGGGHLLDTCIANFINVTGCSIREAIELVTGIPNQIIDKDNSRDLLEVNSRANLLQFSFVKGDRRLNIEKNIVDGRCVYLA